MTKIVRIVPAADRPRRAGVRGPIRRASLGVSLTGSRAVLFGRCDVAPRRTPVAGACAVTKRDRRVGERLDRTRRYTGRADAQDRGMAHSRLVAPFALPDGDRSLAANRTGCRLAAAR